MKALSKFFTPPLSPRDRAVFCECLGFGDLAFRFLEISGQLVLRAREYKGLTGRASLSPLQKLLEEDLPLLISRHTGQQLSEEPFQKNPSLWEELFPYPLSLVGRLFSEVGCEKIQLGPAPLKSRFKLLWEALQRLEEQMSTTEVSCLWIKGGLRWEPLELPMLFHYVRRKRVRVGTAPHLRELGEEYRRGRLSPDSLREQFGTQSAFYYLGLEGLGTGEDLIPSLVDRMLRMLEAAGAPNNVSGLPVLTDSAPRFEL